MTAGAALLAVSLVVYNNALNLWPPFTGRLYVPINLAATTALIAIAFGPLGLDADSLGVARAAVSDVLVGGLLGAVLTGPLFALAVSRRAVRLVADRRVEGLKGSALAYQVLVRIPLGTALFEEVAFRGVLFGALRATLGTSPAGLLSSVVFGLWHISPTVNAVRANRAEARARSLLIAVAGAVLFTTAAGLVFVWLRITSGALAVPFGLHATVNALGTLAAVVATRRVGGRPRL